MRGGGNTATRESLDTEVSQIENFVNAIRTALIRMNLSNGYKLWQIDYSRSNYSAATANATCTTAACKLFDANGGGLSVPYVIPAKLLQSESVCVANSGWARNVWFTNISVKNVGIDNRRDLLLHLPAASDDLCKAVNRRYGVANGSIPDDAPDWNIDYSGTLTGEIDLNYAAKLGDEEATIAGKQMFCARRPSDGCNIIWAVLYER